jgi:ketosteroid isomerase-like protein
MSEEVVRQKVSLRGQHRRTLDERLAVLAPGLMRGVAILFLRLSPRSRLRRTMVARNLCSQYEALNRGDYELILSRCDPEAEWVFVGDAKPPGMKESYRGRAGGTEFMRDWFEGWGDLKFELVEVIDAGDGRLAAAYRQRGRGSGSGVELTEPGAQVITLRDGVAIRVQTFTHPEEALAELGISKEAAGRRE